MLWLALHLPRLPLEVFERAAPLPGPAVVVAGDGRTVVLPNAAAMHHGIAPGQKLPAALALVSGLEVHTRNRPAEQQALESLALWAEQFTPTLHLQPPDALLLEVGGCLRLFGGLDALAGCVRDGLAELGFDATLASAPTPAGALLLARNGLDSLVTELPALRSRLRMLPVDSIEAEAAVLQSLARLGARTVDDVLRLPREGLARRFGTALLDGLDRALGHRPDPRAPFVPPARFENRLVLPAPVPTVEPLLFGLRRLAVELCGFLAGRQEGATRLRLRLEHEDHPPTGVRLELSMPSRDAAHLMVLARERLSRLALPGPVEAFGLTLEESAQLAPRSLSFLAEPGSGAESRAALVERLRARLGRDAVHGLALVPEHRPELAHRVAEPGTPAASLHHAPRPLWLLATPRPLAAGPQGPRLDGPLALLDGPERIESGWWDEGDVRRDYFVARDNGRARLWIYREIGPGPGERWYLQGLFA